MHSAKELLQRLFELAVMGGISVLLYNYISTKKDQWWGSTTCCAVNFFYLLLAIGVNFAAAVYFIIWLYNLPGDSLTTVGIRVLTYGYVVLIVGPGIRWFHDWKMARV